MAFLDFKAQTLKFHPTIFPRVMAIFGVTHVLSPYPQNGVALPLAGRAGHAYIYRVPNAARVRFVAAARAVANENEGLNRLVADDFDPDGEVVVHDVARCDAASNDRGSRGKLRARHRARDHLARGRAGARHRCRRVARRIPAPCRHLLPGLVRGGRRPPGAGVSRQPDRCARCHVPRGHHDRPLSSTIRQGSSRGLQITMLSVSLLILWLAVAAYADRRRTGAMVASA